MRRLFIVFVAIMFLALGIVILAQMCPKPPKVETFQWETQTIATDAGFRGLCVVNDKVAWVSGTKGTIGKTIDGGTTWKLVTIPDTEALDFRDIEAFSADVAYALSAGDGDASRIYKTTDGGATWKLQFTNKEPKGFFDAIAFWDEQHGLALGDPVGGAFQILKTRDGGATWKLLPSNIMVPPLPNESVFAASGTCLITDDKDSAWFVTGGANVARVFNSPNRGEAWSTREIPLAAGNASTGAFSIAFRDEKYGLIVGGDYKQAELNRATTALMNDGSNWQLTHQQLPFRSGVVWANDRWLAVGTSGSHMSRDGNVWTAIDSENYNVIATKAGHTWAAGPKGRIAKLVRR